MHDIKCCKQTNDFTTTQVLLVSQHGLLNSTAWLDGSKQVLLVKILT
jgi:hypothetical protein